jgi:tetratricopeptide (TPR) repeat protein/transcriptional regulator with XRE-family HTH domain
MIWTDNEPIGELIERIRDKRGKSQYALAEDLLKVSGNTSIDREYVHRWEIHKRIPTPYWRRHLSVALDIPIDVLDRSASVAKALRAAKRTAVSARGFDRVAGEGNSDLGAVKRGADTGPAFLPLLSEVDVGFGRPVFGKGEGVDRGEFLMLTGATLASVLAPPLVHGWPDRQRPHLPGPSDRLLAQIQAQTEGYRWLDRRHGARGLLPETSRHARSLTDYWRLMGASHTQRPELAVAAADACHLVAYQAFDQGQRTQAIEWYRCSAELAAHARAQDLYTFAMCGVAYMHARNGSHELSLSVLHQLASLRLSSQARCYISVYEAHAHTSARRRDAALEALDRAIVYSEQTRGEAASPWLGMADRSFVERQRAMVMAEFGVPEAVAVLAGLEEHTSPVFQRYRVMLLTNQAMAHARMAHVEEAADKLTSAIQRNQHTGSIEKETRMLDVRSALHAYGDCDAVRALDELIAGSKR